MFVYYEMDILKNPWIWLYILLFHRIMNVIKCFFMHDDHSFFCESSKASKIYLYIFVTTVYEYQLMFSMVSDI